MTTLNVTENLPFNLTARDRSILAMRDGDYKPLTWEQLKVIIAANRLEDLTRYPSDLARYLQWSHETKASYGNMTNYLLSERLHWTASSFSPDGSPNFDYKSAIPFTDPADYKILPNDWPYGLAEGISHIVIWLKPRLDTEPESGMITAKGARLVEDFVDKMFVQQLGYGGAERVLWFKNWTRLQSVRGIEHVHVLVKDGNAVKMEELIKERL